MLNLHIRIIFKMAYLCALFCLYIALNRQLHKRLFPLFISSLLFQHRQILADFNFSYLLERKKIGKFLPTYSLICIFIGRNFYAVSILTTFFSESFFFIGKSCLLPRYFLFFFFFIGNCVNCCVMNIVITKVLEYLPQKIAIFVFIILKY